MRGSLRQTNAGECASSFWGPARSAPAWRTSLSREENDISVVDIDPERLRELQEKLDIRTVLGTCRPPETLIRAGIEDAELLIALTNSDETNMVACQVAYSLFNTPTKVARIRATDYLSHPELFTRDMPRSTC